MDLMKPRHPADLAERVSKEYPVNCIGCEHLRVLPDRTTLCTFGGSPRKVDVLDPLLANRRCKHAGKPDLPER
jgi:hypothetical protein